jgi:hypothetical protein
VKKIATDNQKIQALITRRVGDALGEKFKTSLKVGELTVQIPREAFYTEKLYLVKVLLATELFKYLPKIKKVVYTETHERPEIAKPKKTKKTTTKKSSPKKKTKKTPTKKK